MYKVVPIGGWNFGMEPMVTLKVASSGFMGSDRDEFLHKRAGDQMFADLIGRVKLGSGDIPIHTIAIGATEGYGPNRNADGFNEATCRKRAHTFEARPLREYGGTPSKSDGARYYISHKNDDPHKSYGYIKAAAYNERMRRIELLMIGNGSKEAAARNGGLELPEEIKQALYDGDYRGGSMSVVLPYDECVICHNHAPNRSHYCTKESCIGSDGTVGLGCRDGLGQLLKDGRQQFVENPNGHFFDFSDVGRPADRTAYGGLAREFMNKAASYGSNRGGDMFTGGADLAELYGMFSDGLVLATANDMYNHKQLKLARVLAALEGEMDIAPKPEDFTTKMAYDKSVQPDINFSSLGEPLTTKFGSGLRALAEAEVMLNPRDFLQLVSPGIDAGNLKRATDLMRLALPRAFRNLYSTEKQALSSLLDNAFAIDSSMIPSKEQRGFAAKVASTRSYCICQLSNRASLASIRGADIPQIKQAGTITKQRVEVNAEALAEKYALYQLATLAASEKDLPTLTLRAVLVHNRC